MRVAPMFAYLAFFLFGDLARLAPLARAYYLGVIPGYRWFLLYLLSSVFQSFAYLVGDRFSIGYVHWWLRTEPLVIAFSLAAACELWFRVMRSYRSIRRIYPWLVPAFLGIALTLTLLSAADLFLVDWRPTIYRIFTLIIRYTASVEAVVCSLLFIWTLLFPDQISSNLRRHAAILSLNYLLISAVYFTIGMRNGRNIIIGNALNLLDSAIYIAWVILITRAGETPPSPREFPDEEVRRTRRDLDQLGNL